MPSLSDEEILSDSELASTYEDFLSMKEDLSSFTYVSALSPSCSAASDSLPATDPFIPQRRTGTSRPVAQVRRPGAPPWRRIVSVTAYPELNRLIGLVPNVPLIQGGTRSPVLPPAIESPPVLEGNPQHSEDSTVALTPEVLWSGNVSAGGPYSDSDSDASLDDAEPNASKEMKTMRRLLSKLSDLNLTHLIHRETLRLIGCGGYADIFTGILYIDGKRTKIAAKRIRVNMQTDLVFTKRATREIRVWSKIHHCNVLPLLGFMLEEGSFPIIISEWMDNGTVLDFVKKMPSFDIYPLVEGIASGLNHLHLSGIVHADLKSDNIVISPDHKPLIMDFGISHLLMSTSTFESATRAEKGSARWMAIELLHVTGETAAEEDVHTKMSDVWAFGMTVLELLTKQRPYHHLRTDPLVMFAIFSYTLPSPPERREWGERYTLLWEICRRCWAREPNERPEMHSLCQELTSSEIIVI